VPFRPRPVDRPAWVIIGTLVSLPRKRLVATLVALMACAWAGSAVLGATLPPSTWVALTPPPQQGQRAIVALGVSPTNNQVVLAGTDGGALVRSTDGGSTWKVVHSGSAGLLAITFSPNKAGLVLAGTRGAGALASKDGGVTWAAVRGMEGRKVKVFGFALTFVAAGTDRGVYVSPDGITWKQSGLLNTNIDALAVAAVHDPVRLVAGSDAPPAAGGMPLYQSIDGGTTWAQMRPSINGNFVSGLAAGPLPPTSTIRPLIVGTNAGLFTSRDNGVSFTPNSGGGLLPSTDYTQIAFITTHFDRYYAASDGGASTSGGLWRTRNGGRSFVSLSPPVAAVTSLALSNDEAPILYVATFTPADQTAAVWAYHDTGGAPQGPPSRVTPPPASGSRITPPAPSLTSGLIDFLLSSRAPYILLGLLAVIVIVFAVVSHFLRRRG
jgi:photosystem II stability/assembly factor-like uncharacterized protein